MPPSRGHYQEKEMSVTLEEIRLYLRVDGNSDDGLIETLKDSAEQICSDILRNDDPDVLYGTRYGKAAVLYAINYMYEHRTEADWSALKKSLRAMLSGARQESF